METNLTVQQVPIEQLIPADYNPRKWTESARKGLTESLEHFGFIQPLVANSATNRKGVVIGGNFKLDIAIKKGLKTVPVVWVNIPDLKKEKELNLRLNKNQGEFDNDLLAEFDLDVLKYVGFDSKELDKIFKDDDDDDFDLDGEIEKIVKPNSKQGDIYELGSHRLMCGDATSQEYVRKLMGGKTADMVFTDPPYNINYQGGMNTHGQNKRDGIQNDNMSKDEFYDFLYKSIKNMTDVCGGGMYVCMSSSEIDTLKRAFTEGGGHFESFIIWAKNTFTLSRSDFQNQYEPMLYGWPETVKNHYFVGWRNEGNVWSKIDTIQPEYDGKVTKIKVGDYHIEIDGPVTGRILNKKDETDVWFEKKPTRSKEHPTMKPIKLVTKAIRASSLRDGIVLDTFAGSGSTLIACQEVSRICYAMELDPKYVDVIIMRWEKLTGQKAKKL